jgi:hypothetical protein
MPHTASRYMQDLGNTDARIFASPNDLVTATSAGSLTTTRLAAGNWGVVAANTTTGQIAVNVTALALRRLGMFEDTQNQFGSTFGSGLGGVAAGAGSAGTGIPGSAQPSPYRPDLIGAMSALQELTPRTAFKIKGIKLISFDVVYLVSTANATTLTCRVDSIQYINGAVPAVTSVLASGANGLAVAFSANANVINVPIAVPVYSNLADFALWVELGIVTPGGGTLTLYGIDLALHFNFN